MTTPFLFDFHTARAAKHPFVGVYQYTATGEAGDDVAIIYIGPLGVEHAEKAAIALVAQLNQATLVGPSTKFVIEETVPTWITYRAEVYAESQAEAIARFKEGVLNAETLFSDTVDGMEATLEVDGVVVSKTIV